MSQTTMAMPDKASYAGPFRVLIFKETDMFVLCCIDFDIVTQGKTEEQAIERFWRVTVAQIMSDLEVGNEPLVTGGRVPPEYITRWEVAYRPS